MEKRTRESPMRPSCSAVLIVDVQEAFTRRGEGTFAKPGKRWTPERLDLYFDALERRALPNAVRLVSAFRAAGEEVVYTVIESLTPDGRDRSLDHKLSDVHIPRGSKGGRVRPEIAPAERDVVLPKTSSGVFNSTAVDYVLRNLGVEDLAILGLFTDQCVESAVRDASDRGYYVTLVADACVGRSPEEHAHTIEAMRGYARIRNTDELIGELKTFTSVQAAG